MWEGRGEALSLCATEPAKIPPGQRSPGMLTPAPGTSRVVASRGSMAAWAGVGGSQPGWGSQRGGPVGGRGDGGEVGG